MYSELVGISWKKLRNLRGSGPIRPSHGRKLRGLPPILPSGFSMVSMASPHSLRGQLRELKELMRAEAFPFRPTIAYDAQYVGTRSADVHNLKGAMQHVDTEMGAGPATRHRFTDPNTGSFQ